ncbi:hypothetical protein M3Y94_00548600 [Aphelenchoides besseyi]|nr:hypothetical protein M3Y94_00548600 [Aphelenchoides besseyi]
MEFDLTSSASNPCSIHRSDSLAANCRFPSGSVCLASSKCPSARRRRSSTMRNELPAKQLSDRLCSTWIERVFRKRECIKFIPDVNSDRCRCGRLSSAHSQLALSRFTIAITKEANVRGTHKWSIAQHTQSSPTDSYGTIEFQGGPHPHKAQYVRLSFDSAPSDILHLFEHVWNLRRPQLVITIHGGTSAFEFVFSVILSLEFTSFRMPDRLGQLFREGLLKAAETTGAWIITSGVDSGVVRQVAKALDEAGISARLSIVIELNAMDGFRMRSRIVTIGIAPWGVIRKREKLIAKDAHVQYGRQNFSIRNRHVALNDRHSYFLLVDNGTSGRYSLNHRFTTSVDYSYGADIFLRKRLEDFLARADELTYGSRRVPIVCVAMEGGINTLTTIWQYLNSQPPIPTIICEGSGRISDVLAHTIKQTTADGSVDDESREKIEDWVCEMFELTENETSAVTSTVINCARMKNLLTVYRMQENEHNDADQVILLALLRGQNLSPAQQLSLTLAWNRVDLAREEVFRENHEQPIHSLNQAMMDALLLSRVEFVKLLLENGVSLKKFLTINRLEKLYNAVDSSRLSSLSHLCDYSDEDGRITLPEIGVAIERLMGNAYRSDYTTRQFKNRYERYRGKRPHLTRIESLQLKLTSNKSSENLRQRTKKQNTSIKDGSSEFDFKHPINDLMLWAVLTRRHQMARCMFLHGEQALPKALVAIRLYKCMSREAETDYTEVEVSNQLRIYAEEFRDFSLELLSHCHDQDDMKTMRLLTAEQPDWGFHTCLSLAVIANNKRFLAHPCCQILLAELWHGGLRFRNQSNFKVFLAVLFPPTILLLDFKTPARTSKRRRSLSDRSSSMVDGQVIDNYNTITNQLASLFNLSGGSRLFGKKSTTQAPPDHSFRSEHTSLLANGAETQKRVHIVSSRALSEEVQRDSFIDTIGSNRGKKGNHLSSLRNYCRAIGSKLHMFYSAPITSFWIWSLSFCGFLLAFIYTLLIEFPKEVSNIEWFLFAFVVGHGLEHFRKNPLRFLKKLRYFTSEFDGMNACNRDPTFISSRYWNILTTIAVITYLLGFAFRFDEKTVHTRARSYGKLFCLLKSIFIINWINNQTTFRIMKLFDFLSVHPRIGLFDSPYVTMAGKMLLAMSYIIVMLLVTLMAFGVTRQSITFPHEKWSWILVRNIFYKPYFMLYGEVYAGEIDTCGDEGTNCVPGGWIPPILMTMFLLVSNILLINMLIAIFNNIFNVTNAMSQQVWMFQRYEQVLEYDDTPIVPPPFTPLVHLFRLCWAAKNRFCRGRCVGKTTKQNAMDFAIKVELDSEELKSLFDFEEDCMDDLSRRKYYGALTTHHEQYKSAADISTKLHEISDENSTLISTINRLKNRLEILETQQTKMVELMEKTQKQQMQDCKQRTENCNARHPHFSQSKPTAEILPLQPQFLTTRERFLSRNRNSISFSEDLDQMAVLSGQSLQELNSSLALISAHQVTSTTATSPSTSANSSLLSLNRFGSPSELPKFTISRPQSR